MQIRQAFQDLTRPALDNPEIWDLELFNVFPQRSRGHEFSYKDKLGIVVPIVVKLDDIAMPNTFEDFDFL
jgi:hypothetical protein